MRKFHFTFQYQQAANYASTTSCTYSHIWGIFLQVGEQVYRSIEYWPTTTYVSNRYLDPEYGPTIKVTMLEAPYFVAPLNLFVGMASLGKFSRVPLSSVRFRHGQEAGLFFAGFISDYKGVQCMLPCPGRFKCSSDTNNIGFNKTNKACKLEICNISNLLLAHNFGFILVNTKWKVMQSIVSEKLLTLCIAFYSSCNNNYNNNNDNDNYSGRYNISNWIRNHTKPTDFLNLNEIVQILTIFLNYHKVSKFLKKPPNFELPPISWISTKFQNFDWISELQPCFRIPGARFQNLIKFQNWRRTI